MANYKVGIQGDLTVVSYKQKEILQINQREMGLFDGNTIPGIMKPRWDTENEMSFIAPASTPIKKYLAKGCDITKVSNVLRRSIAVINQVGKNQLFINNLLLDTKYVFVREKTGEVFFVYEPYMKNVPPTDVRGFFITVIKMAKIKDKTQQAELAQLQAFVLANSRLEDLGNYLSQLKNRMGNSGMMVGSLNPPADMAYIPPMEDEGTTVLCAEDERTTVLCNDIEPETTVLRREPIITMTRSKDGSVTQLHGRECTIGRSADNYIVIRDITDISRHHAIIFMDKERYALMDNDSTNGTTVNGALITPNMEVEIHSGDTLAFANEEFTFSVME